MNVCSVVYFAVILSSLSSLSSGTFWMQICPIQEMNNWPTGNKASPHFDDTLTPDNPEQWRESWMSQLSDDKRFNDVTIPGTHETLSYFGGLWTQCNTWPLSDQLNAGLRFIDVRANLVNDEIQIWHGPIPQNNCLVNVIQDIVMFLQVNPSEFVMMRLRDNGQFPNGNTMTFTEAVFEITDQYDQDYFWKQSGFPNTIGDVRGKLMILREWGDPVMWGPVYGQNSVIIDDFEVKNRLDLEAKWSGNVDHLNTVPSGDLDLMHIMYNSGTGLAWPPKRVAKKLNKRLFNHLNTLSQPSRRGIILFDFPGYDIIGKVIELNENISTDK